jgi:hypothetical protein
VEGEEAEGAADALVAADEEYAGTQRDAARLLSQMYNGEAAPNGQEVWYGEYVRAT